MFTTLVAVGVLILLVLLVVTFIAWKVKAPFAELIASHAHVILKVVFVGSAIGSLIFEHILNFPPCLLCWYQRIAIFSIGILLFTDDIRTSKLLQKQVMVLGTIGLAVALFHNYIDIFPTPGLDVCGAGPSCLARYVYEFGFVTIPFMSAVVLGAGILLTTLIRRYPQNKVA